MFWSNVMKSSFPDILISADSFYWQGMSLAFVSYDPQMQTVIFKKPHTPQLLWTVCFMCQSSQASSANRCQPHSPQGEKRVSNQIPINT
jgi:hypothetical protein